MSENITVIDYEEIKFYTLINKKGREIKSSFERSAYIDNDEWEHFQRWGIRYINDSVYNNMDSKEVEDISSGFHFFIYNEFIRKVDDYRVGDYIRLMNFDTIKEIKKDDFTISPYFWEILYKKPLKICDILDDRNSVLVKYMCEENYVSIIPKEAIRYVCTAQEVAIFNPFSDEDKQLKLSNYFSKLLSYNNTENIDDFLKRFKKV